MLEEDTFFVDDDTVIAGVIGTGMLPADRAKRVIDTCPTKAISAITSRDSRPRSEDASDEAIETDEEE